MIVFYKKLPAKVIRQQGKELVTKAQEFFAANPRRKVAKVAVWYGRIVNVRRRNLEQDVQDAVNDALAGRGPAD